MSGVVVDGDGAQWWTTAYACRQLGVAPHVLWDWVRRTKADPAFPRVDPPRRRGRLAAYRADQLLAAELHTATRGRGRPRRADDGERV